MGCKQSKYAIGDDRHGYHDGHGHYKGDPADMDGGYPHHGIETDIIPVRTHGYIGNYACEQGSNSQKAVAPMSQLELAPSPGMCSEAHFTHLAEGCTAGFLEMFNLSNNKKLITNGPDQINAYQRPAYNYQTPSSDLSNSQAHSQSSSQRRAVLVQNGSFTL